MPEVFGSTKAKVLDRVRDWAARLDRLELVAPLDKVAQAALVDSPAGCQLELHPIFLRADQELVLQKAPVHGTSSAGVEVAPRWTPMREDSGLTKANLQYRASPLPEAFLSMGPQPAE